MSWLALILVGLSVTAQAGDRPKVFIGINGGNGELTNYDFFEKDLWAFASEAARLRFNKIKLLNGGGIGGNKINVRRVGDDDFVERDSDGNLVLSTNKVPGEAATRANVLAALREARELNPSSVVLFVGDHGSPGEWGTWDKDEGLAYSSERQILSLFAGDTLVRTIHDHCYSANALAEDRPVKSLDDLLIRYPANHCGFAVTDFDELGTDVRWPSTLTSSDFSLKDLKRHFESRSDLAMTPRLTSDLFKRSLLNFVCAQAPHGHDCADPSSSNDLVQVACRTYSYARESLRPVMSQYLKLRIHDDEVVFALENLVGSYLVEKYPQQSLAQHSYYRKLEAKATRVQEGLTPELPTATEIKANEFLQERRTSLSFGRRGFVSGFNGQFSNWHLHEQKDDHDLNDFRRWLREKKIEVDRIQMPAARIFDLHKESYNNVTEVVKQKKQQQMALDRSASSVIKTMLQNDQGEVLRRLENIEKCEALPLSASKLE